MDDREFIKKIETEYDINSIKVNNIKLWGLLRTAYITEYIYKNIQNNENIKSVQKQSVTPIQKIKRVRNIFFGISNILRRREIYAFSDTMELREMNGKYINKIFDVLMDKKSFLLVENPVNGNHAPINKRRTKNIISLDIFSLLSKIIIGKRKIIDNEDILIQINEKYGLNVDAKIMVKKFFKYRGIFKFFLSLCRPKAIMLSCYYGPTYQSLIYASKEKSIPVIEIQHGLIKKDDPFYTSFAKLENNFFPDYLLVWGENTKKSLQQRCLIKTNNIFPIGSTYIEYMNKTENKKLEMQFIEFRKEYKRIVAITAQNLIEYRLFNFIINSALMSPDILYLYIPRGPSVNYDNKFLKNIKIIKDFNAYQIIKYSDFHATVFSSCAIEAPALGIQNILININNESKMAYSNILVNRNISKYVDSEKEFVKVVRSWKVKSKKEIKYMHKDFIVQNHSKHISKALKAILLGEE